MTCQQPFTNIPTKDLSPSTSLKPKEETPLILLLTRLSLLPLQVVHHQQPLRLLKAPQVVATAVLVVVPVVRPGIAREDHRRTAREDHPGVADKIPQDGIKQCWRTEP
jgi:hypothetical protein